MSRSRYYAETGPTAGWRERQAARRAEITARLLARKGGKPFRSWDGSTNDAFVPDLEFNDFLERHGS